MLAALPRSVATLGRRGRKPRAALPRALLLLAAVASALFALPLAGLVLRAPWSRAWVELGAPEVLEALRLSFVCSLSATALAVLLGLPLAWVLARVERRGIGLLRGLVMLPVVLPPVVGGIALLAAFGRRGLVGSLLERAFGVTLPFSTAGAVLAEAFVAMPFFVLTMEGALRATDLRLEDAARTLGAKPWTVIARITLPLARPSLLAGALLCWARALGEFGATITFAGNFPGRTQTLPLAVYVALETRPEAALLLSLALLVVSLLVLAGLRRRWLWVS
jgi:molybdate transport system permease protein